MACGMGMGRRRPLPVRERAPKRKLSSATKAKLAANLAKTRAAKAATAAPATA